MSVAAGQAKLEQASQKLVTRWRETRPAWRDSNSQRFEDEYIMAWVGQIRTAAAAMETMNRILAQIRRDCT